MKMRPILRLHGPMRRSASLNVPSYASLGLPSLEPFARNLGHILFAVVLSACGRPFDIKTPSGMVELDKTTEYPYRAMTPDGVVLGVRVVKDSKAGVPFWAQAVALHMKELSGYALLATREVASLDGSKGTELTFGHDESGKPYTYVVRLFAENERLFVVEAGGTKDEMERAKPTVEWALATLKVK